MGYKKVKFYSTREEAEKAKIKIMKNKTGEYKSRGLLGKFVLIKKELR